MRVMRIKSFSQSGPPALSAAFARPDGSNSAFGQTDVSAIWPVGEMMGYCCFVAVAEELHFTRASHRLRMDQSVVSRHIQKLESHLGLKLFVRGERRVELTDAGRAFFPSARKALISAKAGVRIAQAIARGEPQELEVAYSTFVSTRLIAQIKELVESVRPRIPVRFRSTRSDNLFRGLFEGVSHLAVTILPVEEEVASARLLQEELLAVVPSTHRLAQRERFAIGEIADDPVIWASGVIPAAFTKDLFDRFRRASYIPNVAHEAQTIDESLGLAREGMGITFIKASDRHLVGDGLTALPLLAPFPIETGLLFVRERKGEFLSGFISLVTNRFCVELPASTAGGAAPSAGL